VTLREERKGVRFLVEAVRMMDDASVVVAFAGLKLEQPLEEEFETFCVGPVGDEATMSRFYSAADLVVSPSLMETLGQTLVEASASGVPTVAFAGSGTEDAIRDGVNGRLVGEISAGALATAIRDLKANERLRQDMAFWGPLFARNEFSIHKSYHSFYRAFEEIGLYSTSKFRRQIIFAQETVKDIPLATFSHGISVRYQDGISEELGPYVPLNIREHRWIRERQASMGIYNNMADRRAKLVFSLRNPCRNQRLRISHNDILHFDRKLPANFEEKQLFEIDVWLPRGYSMLRFHLTKIKLGFDGQPQAVLLEDLLIV
jgi:hypothetical protein